MPANMSDDDVLNLASLYATRAKIQPSMANISSIANQIRAGNIPPEIQSEYVAIDAGMGASNQPLAKPGMSTPAAAPISAPVPSARPEPSLPSGPTSRGSARPVQAAPTMTEDDSSSPIPLFPLVTGYKPSNAEGPTTQSGAKPDTVGMEGEVLGPEKDAPTAIEDKSGKGVSRQQARTGRDNGRVVPTDYAAQPKQIGRSVSMPPPPSNDPMTAPLPGPNDPSARIPSPQNMPQYGAPQVMADVAPAPDGSGAIRVDVQGKGTFYLTQDGRILDNAGNPISGVVPPDIEASVMQNPRTANMYNMFRQSLRMVR